MPIKKITQSTGHSRKPVRNVIRSVTGDVFRARQCSMDCYLPQLDPKWAAGCRDGAELCWKLRASGLTGNPRVVRKGRRAAGAASAHR